MRKSVIICTISIGLAACAGNALRIEGADAVGKAATDFTESAISSLNEAKARRIEANSTLVASDPSCEPRASVNIYVRKEGTRRAGSAPLCADGRTPRLGYDLASIDLRPLPEETLKPTILLIGAIGDYGAALVKVSQRPNTDISKELASLAAKASEAATLANGLLGLDLPDAQKLLASNQAKAAIALVQFANNLAEEQARVRDIRDIVDKHGDEAIGKVRDLNRQLDEWLLTVTQGDAQVIQNNLMRSYRTSRWRMTYDQRLAMVTTINQARLRAAAYPQRLEGLKKGLASFVEAEGNLRRLLRGEYTKEERRRIAELNQQRMLEALRLMAGAISAFGGL